MAFRLNKIFSNGLVLQRNKAIRIFGTGDEGEIIYVLFNGLLKSGEIEKGKFFIEFPAFEAAKDLSMMAYSNTTKIIVNDICIGDVYLAAGQSNMEFLLKYEKNFRENIKKDKDPYIRFFDVFKKTYSSRDSLKELKNQYNIWRKDENIDDLKEFSAVSYYFLKKLREKVNVPLAVIGCTYGGSSAASWLPFEVIEQNKILEPYIKENKEILEKIQLTKYKKLYKEKDKWALKNKKVIEFNERVILGTITNEEIIDTFNKIGQKEKELLFFPKGPFDPTFIGTLYENMFKEIIPFNFKGVIYYQGESDENHYDIYKELLTTLINKWRSDLNDDLAFFIMMLAPFKEWLGNKGTNFKYIREAQLELESETNKVYVTNIMDDGEEFDIHPKDKKIVGERLALLALDKLYGEKILSSGPRLKDIKVSDENIKIEFSNVGQGLIKRGDRINDFYINDKDINELDVTINVDSVEVKNIFNDSKVIKVEYLYKDFPRCNLSNSSNLPAFPFNKVIEIKNEISDKK